MTEQTGWFIAGLVVVALLSMYAPKFAGVLVLLVVTVLAIKAADKQLV